MTQVVTGDVIDDADYNNMRDNIEKLFGEAPIVGLGTFTASNTYGWNQGGSGVSAVSAGEVVDASSTNGFKDLQDDVQAMCAFLGVSVRTGVGSDVTSSDTITGATWSNTMLNIQDCWNNRFSPASRTAATDGSTTRTAAWTNTLTQETSFAFSSQGAARAYFNAGGGVGVGSSRSGGSSHTQNTQWTNKLNAISDVFLYHDTTSGSAGTSAGIGFYELTTSYQQLLIYYGGASPYTSDYVKVEGRVNSVSAPTTVYIKITLLDAGDNVLDQNVDGTLTISARRNSPNANGSGFSFANPSATQGSIVGT
jgi:hypothetical protein